MSPLAPDRYEIRFTASGLTREKLRLAQDLLRHAIPAGDLAEIVDRALTVLLGVCAFVSKGGRRCNERAFIQFHHVDPHSVGGEATVKNIQLRCGAHNRYEGALFYGHGRPIERITRPGKSSSPPP